MALLTISTLTNATAGTIPLPVNASLASRCIRSVFVGSDGTAAGGRNVVSISNVRAAGGVSFTMTTSNESPTNSGFVKELTRDTYFVNAGVLATVTYFGSSAITGSFGISYDEVPKTAGMTGT